MDAIAVFGVLGAMILFYFAPTIVCVQREHNNMTAIIVLNLFTGWTMIGWFVALVWACTDNIKKTNRTPHKRRRPEHKENY